MTHLGSRESVDWDKVKNDADRGLLENTFMLACMKGEMDQIESILEKDVSIINYAEKDQMVTPLHAAVHENKREVVTTLLKHPELNVSARDSRGSTPLDEAFSLVKRHPSDVKDSSLFFLSEKILKVGQDILNICLNKPTEDSGKREVHEGLRKPDEVKDILLYLFPEATVAEVTQGGALICSFPCGSKTPITLIYVGEKSYFSMDKTEEELKQHNNDVVLRKDCSQEKESFLWAISLMKAASEWLMTEKGQLEKNGNSLEKFIEGLSKMNDDTVIIGRQIIEAVQDEVQRTRQKVNMCVEEFERLKLSNFSNPDQWVVTFLRFLEAFALQDSHQKHMTRSQGNFIAKRKKDYFARLFSMDVIYAVRGVRVVFYDRHYTKTYDSWPRFLSVKNVLETTTSFQHRDWNELEMFVKAANETLKGTSSAINRQLVDRLKQILVCDLSKYTEEMTAEDVEKSFYESATKYIRSQDADERDRLRYTLEFHLIVNMRGLIDDRGLGITPRPIVLRNKRAHLRSACPVETEDIASGIFDYYRCHLSKIVQKELRNYQANNLLEDLRLSMETFNKKFKNVDVWFTETHFLDYSGSFVDDLTVEPREESSNRGLLMGDYIKLYVQFMVPLLFDERENVRNTYRNMNGDEKRDLLEYFYEGNHYYTEKELIDCIGFSKAEAEEFLQQKQELSSSIDLLYRDVADVVKVLNNIKEYAKQDGITWKDVEELYKALVQENGRTSCLSHILSLQNLEPRRKEAVEKRIGTLAELAGPKIIVQIHLGNSRSIWLKDIITDLLSLLTCRAKRVTLLIKDPESIFNDKRVVEYLVNRNVQVTYSGGSQSSGFFLNSSNEDGSKNSIINNKKEVLSMIKLLSTLKEATPFTAILISKMEEHEVPLDTVRLVIQQILSSDNLLPILHSIARSPLELKVVKCLWEEIKAREITKDGKQAVLEVLIKSKQESQDLPSKFISEAFSLIFELIEREKFVDAARLVTLTRTARMTHLEQSYTKLCQAHLLNSIAHSIPFDDTDNRRKAFDEALKELGDVKSYQDRRHKMMALSLKAFIYGSLAYLETDSTEKFSINAEVVRIADTLHQELWKYVSSQDVPPPFDIYCKKCHSSHLYKGLIASDHFCRRFLNVYKVKDTLAYGKLQAGRASRTREDRYEFFQGALQDYQDLHLHDFGKELNGKYGPLRTLQRYALCCYELGSVCTIGSEKIFYLSKATELQLLLIETRELILGPSHPDDNKVLGYLKKYVTTLRQELRLYQPEPRRFRSDENWRSGRP